MKKKRKKLKSVRSLKIKAWHAFSELVRRSAADEGGTVECYTCGKLMHWKDSQAGHFVAGRTNAVLLNPDVVRVQCERCNVWLGGNIATYTLKMVDECGRERVDELLSLKNQTVKWTRTDLEELISGYREKLERIP